MKIKTIADRTGQDEVLFLMQPTSHYLTLSQYQKLMYALAHIEGVELDYYESRFEKYRNVPAVQK